MTATELLDMLIHDAHTLVHDAGDRPIVIQDEYSGTVREVIGLAQNNSVIELILSEDIL
jgi:hypothetical protein